MAGSVAVDRGQLQAAPARLEAWVFTGMIHRARRQNRQARWVLRCTRRVVSPVVLGDAEAAAAAESLRCARCWGAS